MQCKNCKTEIFDLSKFCPRCGATVEKSSNSASQSNQSYEDMVSTADFEDEVESTFQIGEVVANRYEILSELGRGGMGSVYKVKDATLKRVVALKAMHPRFVNNEKAINRFENELRLSSELGHPNIVSTWDINVHNNVRFFTMEFVEGNTLQHLISENKTNSRTFSFEETVSIIRQVCEGLQYAHQKTVHRDIKPGNIMIIKNSNKPGGIHVKINDFGIAKMASSSQFTAADASMGTAYYMDPEQLSNASTADCRADIFSLGVVIYEMLTGALPQGRFQLPSEIRKDLPKEMDKIIEKTLQPNPSNRYQTVKELADELVAIYQRTLQPKQELQAEPLQRAKLEEIKSQVETQKQVEKEENKIQAEVQRHVEEKIKELETLAKERKQEFEREKAETRVKEVYREEITKPAKSNGLIYGVLGAFLVLILIGGILFVNNSKNTKQLESDPNNKQANDIKEAVSEKAKAEMVAMEKAKDEKEALEKAKAEMVAMEKAKDEKKAAEKEKIQQEISQYLKEGEVFYNNGKYELCIEKMKEVLNRNGNNFEAKEYLKMSQNKLKEIEEEFKNPKVGRSR